MCRARWQQLSALLDEAQKAFDSMPDEARGLRTSRWVEGLIGEARRSLI
jgi:hypothetical protein